MKFIDQLKEKAKQNKKTIVLPETSDMRTIEAAGKVLAEGIANIILVGDKEDIMSRAGDIDLSGASFVDPKNYEKFDEYVDAFVEMRRKKGMTEARAKELLLTNPLYFGCMMVKQDEADGMVAGAINASADVLRAALQTLKTVPGTRIVSAFFLVVVPDCQYGANGTFVFADAGLNQSPSASELADIAEQSAKSLNFWLMRHLLWLCCHIQQREAQSILTLTRLLKLQRSLTLSSLTFCVMVSFSQMQHSFLRLQHQRHLEARLQDMRMFLCSLILMQRTSDTSLCRDSQRLMHMVLLHRVLQSL